MIKKFLHVDGDSFFALCELARFPELKGVPVVVGQDRGIACAMNYEAKQLGIHRAMPIFKIKREFPEVVILTSHFELYEMYSMRLYRILQQFSDTVEKYSIDECFALLREQDMKPYGSWEAFVDAIKHEIQTSLGITFSFGLADTKVLAKTASKINKPNGRTIIYPENRVALIYEIPIESVWGIGYRLTKQMRTRGIRTVGEFLETPRDVIARWFTKPVHELWLELHGTSLYAVGEKDVLPKSLQATRSFKRTNDKAFIWSELSRDTEIVASRLRTYGLTATSVQFFLKHGIREYTTGHINLTHSSNNPSDILREVSNVFDKLYKPRTLYRATGITVHNLIDESVVARDLFGEQDKVFEQKRLLDAVDTIRKKYGTSSISLGTSLRSVTHRDNEQAILNEHDPYIWGLPLPFLGETV